MSEREIDEREAVEIGKSMIRRILKVLCDDCRKAAVGELEVMQQWPHVVARDRKINDKQGKEEQP